MDEICSVYCEDLGKTDRVITESNRAWLWPLIMLCRPIYVEMLVKETP